MRLHIGAMFTRTLCSHARYGRNIRFIIIRAFYVICRKANVHQNDAKRKVLRHVIVGLRKQKELTPTRVDSIVLAFIGW